MSEGGVVMANPECIVTRLRLRARQFGVMPMRCCITNASCAIQSPRSQGRRGENERSGWVGFRQDCRSWKGAAIARTCEQLPASSRTCAVTISGHANPHRPRGPHHPRLNVYATHVTLTSKKLHVQTSITAGLVEGSGHMHHHFQCTTTLAHDAVDRCA